MKGIRSVHNMRLERVSWPQAEEYFKHHDTVIIPLGSIECHGRHMPLGTDNLIPERIIERIEEKNGTMIAPMIPYGCTDYLADYPGTINLGHDLLYQLLKAVTSSLKAHGARRFVVINGHGGNIPPLDRVSLDLYKEGCLLAQMNWWQMVWNITADWKGNKPWHGGHGGAEETAAILAIDPSLVDQSKIADAPMNGLSKDLPASGIRTVRFKGVDIPVNRMSDAVSDNGWFGDDHPGLATKEWGEELIRASAEYISEFIEVFKTVALPEER